MPPTAHLIIAFLFTVHLAAACILRALCAIEYADWLEEFYTT